MTKRIAEADGGRVWMEWDGFAYRTFYIYRKGRPAWLHGITTQEENVSTWEVSDISTEDFNDGLTESEAVQELWRLATEGV